MNKRIHDWLDGAGLHDFAASQAESIESAAPG